jgi:hypothetical protein
MQIIPLIARLLSLDVKGAEMAVQMMMEAKM